MGNHDSWPYQRNSDGSFNQSATPIGDQYFAATFGDLLNVSSEHSLPFGYKIESWPQSTCLNKDYNFQSWFHNYAVVFPNFSESFRILGIE